MTKKLEFDIVLWGGSSFVGKLVAEHLDQKYGVEGQIRWAIGGRKPSMRDAVINTPVNQRYKSNDVTS